MPFFNLFTKGNALPEPKGRPMIGNVTTESVKGTGVIRGLMDSLSNAFSGLGGSSDRVHNTRYTLPKLPTTREAEWALQACGILENIISRPIEDAMSKGIIFPHASADEQKALEDFLNDRRIGWWRHREIAQYTRVMNKGAAIWYDTGAIDPAQPLKPGELKRLRRLIVFDSDAIWGEMSSKYVEPEMWCTGQPEARGGRIHASRLILFPGRFISLQHRFDNQGWGAREIDKYWEALMAYLMTFSIPANIASTYEEPVYKMAGLNKNMTSERGREIIQAKAFDMETIRGYLKVRLVDAEDEFLRNGVDVGRLPELMKMAERYMVASTGQPHTVVLGESPGESMSGAGSGESQREEHQRFITGYQDKHEYDQLQKYLEDSRPVLQERYGLPFEDLRHAYPPLYPETTAQKSEREYKDSQRDKVYIEANHLSREESRNELAKRGVYDLETLKLPPKEPVNLDE